MTPHEELEYICNAAYLRGCDSNFKTAIAGMQESERKRLTKHWVLIEESGEVVAMSYLEFFVATPVYGCVDVLEAEGTVHHAIKQEERERLAELVKLIKDGA